MKRGLKDEGKLAMLETILVTFLAPMKRGLKVSVEIFYDCVCL